MLLAWHLVRMPGVVAAGKLRREGTAEGERMHPAGSWGTLLEGRGGFEVETDERPALGAGSMTVDDLDDEEPNRGRDGHRGHHHRDLHDHTLGHDRVHYRGSQSCFCWGRSGRRLQRGLPVGASSRASS